MEAWKKKDPVLRIREYLTGVGLLDDSKAQEYEARAKQAVDDADQFAQEASFPPRGSRTRKRVGRVTSMTTLTNIEAVTRTLAEEMRRDPNIFITGEDVGIRGGVFRATKGLIEEFGDQRVVDSPLSELSIVATGIGAALYGLHPVVEIQFADFIAPAFNQIVNEAAKFRYRSNGAWPCPLVIRAPYGGGIGGGLYHSQSIEATYAHIPGLYVVAPATPYDVVGMLRYAVRVNDPVLFLEHKKAYRLIKGQVPDEFYVVPFGKAEIKRAGTDLTVIAYGLMLHLALEAAEHVAANGISVEVLDLRSLNPLDKETILSSVQKTEQGADRPRRQPDPGTRRGDRGDHRRRSIRILGCTRHAVGRAGRSRRAVQSSAARFLHAECRKDRTGHSKTSGVLGNQYAVHSIQSETGYCTTERRTLE